MDQITEIYEHCDSALNVIVRKIRDGIKKLSSGEEWDKKKVKKLMSVQDSFTELVSNMKECQGIAKLIRRECERYIRSGDNMSDIKKLQNSYNRCKEHIFMQIGYLQNVLKSQDDFDIQENLDKYMLKCDNISKLDDMLVSQNMLDDLETRDFDLLDELEDVTSNKKRNKKLNTKSKSKKNDDDSFDWDDEDVISEDKSDDVEESDNSDDLLSQSEEISVEDLYVESDNDDDEDNDDSEDFFTHELTEGGLNEESDVVITAGKDKFVVGEKYKFHIRGKLLELKNAEDRDEQIRILGFNNESELDAFCDNLDENYALELIKKYELDQKFIEALDRLEDRIKSYYSQYKKVNKKENKSVNNRYNKILKSFEMVREDPLHWTKNINIDPKLHIIFQCALATEQKKIVKSNQNNLKELLKDTAQELKKYGNKGIVYPDGPGKWEKEFDINDAHEDAITHICMVEKSWLKDLSAAEIYLGQCGEYLDQLWLEEKPTLPDLKYRVYIVSTLKNSPYQKQVQQLIKKYKVGNYSTFNKLLSDFIK